MKNVKTAPWVIGAVLVSVLLSLGAWMTLISPQVEAAAEFHTQNDEALERNEMLRLQNLKLAKQFAEIETYRAQLAEFRTRIPETIDQASFTLELNDLAEQTGAFVVDVAYPASVALSTTNGVAGAAPVKAPNGLYALPVEITILGGPAPTFEYLEALQTKTKRLFFVSSVDLKGQDEAGAASGKPAIKDGDAQILIKGYMYMIDPDAVATTDPGPNGTPGAVAN